VVGTMGGLVLRNPVTFLVAVAVNWPPTLVWLPRQSVAAYKKALTMAKDPVQKKRIEGVLARLGS
jgi:hypothetical protein